MRKWPKNNGLIRVETAIKSLVRWWLDHMRFKPNNRYTGYEFVSPIHHVCCQPDFTLSKEGLKQELEQGRSPIIVLLTVAFQLGVIQGSRMEQNKNQETRELAILLEKAQKQVEEMKNV